MTDLFSDSKPEWLKKAQGQAVANINHGLCLRAAREVARDYAKLHGQVSIDEVREGLICRGFDLSGRTNWLGSTFKSGEFEACGFKRSEHANSHSRIIQLWRLKA
jgi:hypothetical protein